jgi:LPS-assembly lipoprotein
MWSSEPARRARRIIRATTLAVGIAALSACTISPVYGPTPGGEALAAAFAAIEVAPAQDRITQVVRNALLFDFTQGGEPASPRYSLSLSVNVAEAPLTVTDIETAAAYSVEVAVAYELSELDTAEIVTRGVARAEASYNRSNQGFANVRARRDAEDRAAAAAAEDIRIRIAAALATGA